MRILILRIIARVDVVEQKDFMETKCPKSQNEADYELICTITAYPNNPKSASASVHVKGFQKTRAKK